MNEADLTDVLATQAGIPKVHAVRFLDVLTEAIQDALADGDPVALGDFGTFTVSQRTAFEGHNPKDGRPMYKPSRRVPVFRSGTALLDALNPEPVH